MDDNTLRILERLDLNTGEKAVVIFDIKGYDFDKNIATAAHEGDWIYLINEEGLLSYMFAKDHRGIWDIDEYRYLISKPFTEMPGCGEYHSKQKKGLNYSGVYSIQGDDRYIFSKVMENGWVMVITSSVNESISEAKASVGIAAGIQLLIGLIIIVITVSRTRTMTGNVAALYKLADYMVQGDPNKLKELNLGSSVKEFHEIKLSFEKIADSFLSMCQFSNDIGNGNYKTEYYFHKNNALGNSLLKMKESLLQYQTQDKNRRWITEGIADFSHKLRKYSDNIDKLSDNVLRDLVKYMDANQGALYTVSEIEDEPKLIMRSCYAFGRKKFRKSTIAFGEGLAGQACLEKDIIRMTEVPDDYVNITSGLGQALPKAILIVPLMMDGQVYGIIELAGFKVFEEHHIEFIKKLSEAIAGTLSYLEVNEKTKKLLKETEEQAKQMASQEEEMRQNMEELLATQEQMNRMQKENEQDLFTQEEK
ncbi:GAF domain-containing protein [Fulvitalea axinellae]